MQRVCSAALPIGCPPAIRQSVGKLSAIQWERNREHCDRIEPRALLPDSALSNPRRRVGQGEGPLHRSHVLAGRQRDRHESCRDRGPGPCPRRDLEALPAAELRPQSLRRRSVGRGQERTAEYGNGVGRVRPVRPDARAGPAHGYADTAGSQEEGLGASTDERGAQRGAFDHQRARPNQPQEAADARCTRRRHVHHGKGRQRPYLRGAGGA